MSIHDLNKKLGRNHTIIKKAFPGTTSKDLSSHYRIPTLESNTPNIAIIHVGINDVMNKSTSNGLSSSIIQDIANSIIQCGKVCASFGVNNICISSILPKRGHRAQLSIRHINNVLAKLCAELAFDFLQNGNILYDEMIKENCLFYTDGIHLNDAGRQLLMDNFNTYLNKE